MEIVGTNARTAYLLGAGDAPPPIGTPWCAHSLDRCSVKREDASASIENGGSTMANQQDPTKTISPKVVGATLGGAIATIFWVLVSHYWLTGLSKEEVSSLTGATGTLLSFAFGYLVRDPLRRA